MRFHYGSGQLVQRLRLAARGWRKLSFILTVTHLSHSHIQRTPVLRPFHYFFHVYARERAFRRKEGVGMQRWPLGINCWPEGPKLRKTPSLVPPGLFSAKILQTLLEKFSTYKEKLELTGSEDENYEDCLSAREYEAARANLTKKKLKKTNEMIFMLGVRLTEAKSQMEKPARKLGHKIPTTVENRSLTPSKVKRVQVGGP
ncbi:unnamed protein product [Strongylus vulgaris]|uniref:Uncharacterized protein n=1 Tax=Strongylus vulgaris TaxID=40348 RepID=A0A3P7KCQ9_STRVU|nr:unnamed protein product [Strongylus vulgaris]